MNMNRQYNRHVTSPGVPYGRQNVSTCDMGQVSGVVGTGSVLGGASGRMEGCAPEGALQGMPLAMAYVPWQSFGNLYALSQALQCGTLFQELSLDFLGRRCN